jgi:predicted esterase
MLAQSHAKRPASYLVGSSMGGWVALTASATIEVKGVFLLAPAVYMNDYPPHQVGLLGSAIEIIHGWHDSLIPYQNVVRFSKEHLCTLHLVDDEHRLQLSLPRIGEYLTSFLNRMESKSA